MSPAWPERGWLRRYGGEGAAIEARSLTVAARCLDPLRPADPGLRDLMARMVYAAGDPGLVPLLEADPAVAAAGAAALRGGAPVVCDGRMVAAGIARAAAARLGCPVLTAIDDEEVAVEAARCRTTRAAAAMAHLVDRLDGAVAAVGTSPTALLALLDLMESGRCRPAAVVATPPGFAAAAEAKAVLARSGVPHVTVRGTRGGSPLAAAAVNALLALAAGAAAQPAAPQTTSGVGAP